MKREVLQKLMRHQSFETTHGYVCQSQQIAEVVQELQMTDLLNNKCG